MGGSGVWGGGEGGMVSKEAWKSKQLSGQKDSVQEGIGDSRNKGY